MNSIARRMGRRCSGRVALFVAAWGSMGLPGCAAGHRSSAIIWDLARPVDARDIPKWHSRLAAEDSVPVGEASRLCEEFDFVHVCSAADWDRLCKAMGWAQGNRLATSNFAKGSIVGLIARVGEPAADEWPIRLDEVRLDGGRGWIRFHFWPGLYYPVAGPPFVVAAYVPGLHEPRVIEVGRRIFVLNSSEVSEIRRSTTAGNMKR